MRPCLIPTLSNPSRTALMAPQSDLIRVRVGVRVKVTVRTIFERRSGDRTQVTVRVRPHVTSV